MRKNIIVKYEKILNEYSDKTSKGMATHLVIKFIIYTDLIKAFDTDDTFAKTAPFYYLHCMKVKIKVPQRKKS